MPHDQSRPSSAGVGLLGAGANAREIASYLPDRVVFHAVDRAFLPQAPRDAVDIASPGDALLSTPVISTPGAPGLRRQLVERWAGSSFISVVSDAAYVDGSASLGDGCVVAPGAVITTDVVLEDHCQVGVGATISHDSVLEAYSTVSPGVHLAGRVRLGRGVFVGIGASIVQGVTLAEGVVVAAGAVVIADVKVPHTLVMGVPAAPARTNTGWLDAF